MLNNKNIYWYIILLLITSLNYPTIQKMVINVPVADLRAIPECPPQDLQLPTSDLSNPLQITQLLLGEHIVVHESIVDTHGTTWFKVNALQQLHSTSDTQWHGYPGWILANQATQVSDFLSHNIVVQTQTAPIYNENHHIIATLSIGTRLLGKKIDDNFWQIIMPNNSIAYINNQYVYVITPSIQESITELRKKIIQTAQSFLGSWYSWGGRSAQHNNLSISSVDCSAMVNLSFMAHGLQIPRMSHEQFLKSHKITSGKDLQVGDLVFFESINKYTSRMNHVMMYIGNELLLESTFADNHTVRIIPFNIRMKNERAHMSSGDILQDEDDLQVVYFGTFFNDLDQVQNLRSEALKKDYSENFYDACTIAWHKGYNFMQFYTTK